MATSKKPKSTTPDAVPRPVINKLECKACGRCVEACPRDALAISAEYNERGYHYVEYHGSACTGCGNCFYTCPEPGTLEIHRPRKSRPGAPDSEGN